MNNRDWEIIELSQEEIREHYTNYKYAEVNPNGKYFGQTYEDEQKIYLDKDLHKDTKYHTLLHELMHCYVDCYVDPNSNSYDNEALCNISSNSHDIIHDIIMDYFKGAKNVKNNKKSK